MNYRRIYDRLMVTSTKDCTVYRERHHIQPKSLGGSDAKSNVVYLTARQHYVAHRLLVKFLEGKPKWKMVCALHRFTYSKNADYRITSREYAYIKEQHGLAMKNLRSGKRASATTKSNMSKAQKQRYAEKPTHWRGRVHSEATKAKMSIKQAGEGNPQHGKPRTEEERTKNILFNEGKKEISSNRRKVPSTSME